ncbi:MAG: MaoC family dehydratase N-terminal domain-containing protein [Burkholderiales bacterium]|nr:MaoC family dehydratase N-terminal domain-containing protein [Burkholderiales bacterium]
MPIDPDKLLALAIPEIRQSYGWRDTVLYALGVGVGQDPVDERQLAFVDETRLQALPTMASILAHPGFWIRELETGIDWRRVVHAEQSLRVHRPIPAQATVRAVTRVLEVVDKGAGKGALVRYGREILDAGTDTPIATAEQVSICRGAGGFGGSHVNSSLSRVCTTS